MIELGWYFWVILAITLNCVAHDFFALAASTRDNAGPVTVWVLPEIVGLLWCAHHVLEVCS